MRYPKACQILPAWWGKYWWSSLPCMVGRNCSPAPLTPQTDSSLAYSPAALPKKKMSDYSPQIGSRKRKRLLKAIIFVPAKVKPINHNVRYALKAKASFRNKLLASTLIHDISEFICLHGSDLAKHNALTNFTETLYPWYEWNVIVPTARQKT